MAQTFTSTDVVTTTNVFGDNQSQRVNENTLRSNFSGPTQPSNPVVGQVWYDTTNSKQMQYNGTAWVPVDTNGTTQIDVSNAKGNLTSLTSYLRVAHNDDGTLKTSPATAIDEFKDNALVITYVSTSSFTVPMDLTSVFTVNRKLKVYLESSTAITYVSSSSYNSGTNVTTVVTGEAVLNSSVTAIKYSIIQHGMPQDYNLALEESTGYGVISGGSATVSGLTVTIAAVIAHMPNGSRYNIPQSTITVNAADTTNPRVDLIYLSSTGVVSYLAGTAAVSPVAPNVPAGGLVLNKALVGIDGTIILTDLRGFKARYQNSNVINVRDFGAVGDYNPDSGTGNDDTQAFQRAADYIATKQSNEINTKGCAGTAILSVPQGCYKLTKAIKFHGLVIIKGDGGAWYGGASIRQTVIDTNIFEFYGSYGDHAACSCRCTGIFFAFDNPSGNHTGRALYFPKYDDISPTTRLSSNSLYFHMNSFGANGPYGGFIFIDHGDDIDISHNLIDNSFHPDAAIVFGTDTDTSSGVTSVRISDNELWEGKYCTLKAYGIIGASIANNIIASNDWYQIAKGFDFSSNTINKYRVSNINISNNVFRKIFQDIILDGSSNKINIIGNVMDQVTSLAVYFIGTTAIDGGINISNNIMQSIDTNGAAALVYSAAASVSNINIIGNHSYGSNLTGTALLATNGNITSIGNTINSAGQDFQIGGTAPVTCCRARVRFNAITMSILSSSNVSSITKNSTGQYTINFIKPMINAYYSTSADVAVISTWTNKSHSAVPVNASSVYLTTVENGVGADSSSVSVSVFE